MSNRPMDREAEDAHTYQVFKRIVKWLLIIIPIFALLCWFLSMSSPKVEPFIFNRY